MPSTELDAEQYRELVRGASDVVTVVDRDGKIAYESPGAEQIKGWSREELIGEEALAYVHPEDVDRVEEAFGELEAERGRDQRTIEFRFRSKSGEWIWLSATAAAPDSDAAIDGYVVTSRNVTDRKQAERERQRQLDRLESFTQAVSHDLRSPLSVAKGRCELASVDCDSEHLDAIEASLDRMSELIDDLLSLAQAGKRIDETEAVSIETVTREAWEQVTAGTGAETLRLDADAVVEADRSRLQQLLENLLANSFEHGDDPTVEVGLLEAGFYVADDGPGIPEDEREAVFENGYSGAGGTGFGLSIVREIVRAHGWEISVTESDAGGAAFEITGVDFAG
ncbi:MAG: PAS domain-containing sensor histidine kinase [Natronomonas sp.]